MTLSPRAHTIDLGRQWRPLITVWADSRPFAGAPPRVELRVAGQTSRFSSFRVRRGVFRARIAPKRVGRWNVSVNVAGTRIRAGTLTVSPAVTGALDVADA